MLPSESATKKADGIQQRPHSNCLFRNYCRASTPADIKPVTMLRSLGVGYADEAFGTLGRKSCCPYSVSELPSRGAAPMQKASQQKQHISSNDLDCSRDPARPPYQLTSSCNAAADDADIFRTCLRGNAAHGALQCGHLQV